MGTCVFNRYQPKKRKARKIGKAEQIVTYYNNTLGASLSANNL